MAEKEKVKATEKIGTWVIRGAAIEEKVTATESCEAKIEKGDPK